MKSVSSLFIVFMIQTASSLIHNDMNALCSWEFKYLPNPDLLICIICMNFQVYWKKRVFIHLKKCQDTHSPVVNVSRFQKVVGCLSKFCKAVGNISSHQVKLPSISHLSQSQKNWLCNFCSFINTAESKMKMHIKIKHQGWSHLFKEQFHYQACFVQQYHIYHKAEIYFAVISPSVNKMSFNSSRSSFMTVSSFISLLTDIIISHKDFVEIQQTLDQQITVQIQLWEKTEVNG